MWRIWDTSLLKCSIFATYHKIFLLIPHQDRTKQVRRYWHFTWSFPVLRLFEVDKTCIDVPRISCKFIAERKFGLYCYGRDENRIAYLSGLVQLLSVIFFEGTRHTLLKGGYGERSPGSWCNLSCFTSCLSGWSTQFSNPVPFENTRPQDTYESAKELKHICSI